MGGNRVSNAPVKISPITVAVVSAPLVSASRLSWMAVTTESPAWRIWSSEKWKGPAVSQSWICVTDCVNWSVSWGRPSTNCWTTNARIPATTPMPATRTTTTAAERGTPRLCIQSTSGTSNADASSARPTGIRTVSSFETM